MKRKFQITLEDFSTGREERRETVVRLETHRVYYIYIL
jgi:hypothetical protein